MGERCVLPGNDFAPGHSGVQLTTSTKGDVEGEAGYFRRNHWVPVPKAFDLAGLNRQLLDDCRSDEQRALPGETRASAQRC